MNYVFGSELSIKETILRQIYDVKIWNVFYYFVGLCVLCYLTRSSLEEYLQEHVVGRELVQHTAQELMRHEHGAAGETSVGLGLPGIVAELDHSVLK